MSYKVLRPFSDLQDNGYVYNAGDTFPRKGLNVSEERIRQLSTSNNNARQVFIQKADEERGEHDGYPKHVGGRYYELSNGEKVKGKEEALKAEEALKRGES